MLLEKLLDQQRTLHAEAIARADERERLMRSLFDDALSRLARLEAGLGGVDVAVEGEPEDPTDKPNGPRAAAFQQRC